MSPTQTATALQCPACLRQETHSCDYSVAGRFPLHRCDHCGMMMLEIEEAPDEDFDEYWDDAAAEIYRQAPVVEELRRKYRRYFTELARIAPNRRFLDVGSGAGISVDTAGREFGFEAQGIEPSARAVELARERLGVNVECGLLTADSDLPRDFGVVTLWDVIEHVEDPEALVAACAERLAPGGVFLLETPDEGAFLRALIRGLATLGVSQLDVRSSVYYRAHRYYFTREAMRTLLERRGFTHVRFHHEHTMYEKELRYMDWYGTSSPMKKLAVQGTASLTKIIPALGNKMVVTAVKSTGA